MLISLSSLQLSNSKPILETVVIRPTPYFRQLLSQVTTVFLCHHVHIVFACPFAGTFLLLVVVFCQTGIDNLSMKLQKIIVQIGITVL